MLIFLFSVLNTIVIIASHIAIKFNDFRHLNKAVESLRKQIDIAGKKINSIDRRLLVLEVKSKNK
jgi:hypothetical protein